ncbi:MAG TPA: hypothetical protein VKS22_00320 [Candidatus Binataceae bacterium]|nr:hypothetical protein [Candidatus Binataceae bacterium]
MTCQTYIENYLATHADSELDGHEHRLADEHIADCLRCRERFISERQLKTLIRTHSVIAKVPADVRLRIRAALGELIEADSRPAVRPAFADRGGRIAVWARSRSARIALPIAALGSLILALGLIVGHVRTGIALPQVPPTQLFDLAVNKFNAFGSNFVANATDQDASGHGDSYYAWVMDRDSESPSAGESADLARSYREANVPEEIYDFRASGYGLYGGRIDQLAGLLPKHTAGDDPVTYTLYRGEKGQILSICLHAPGFVAPTGARYWAGAHTFYQYKGYSICLTFHPQDHFVSMLVAREPAIDLLRDVTLADQTASTS